MKLKKILSLFTSIVITYTLVCVGALQLVPEMQTFADSDSVIAETETQNTAADELFGKLMLGSVEAAPGETVSIPVSAECREGILSFDITLNWGNILVEAEGATFNNSISGSCNTGYGYCSLIGFDTDVIPDGELAEINFKVPSDAQNGDKYSINVSALTLYTADSEYNIDSTTCINGEITVVDNQPENKNVELSIGSVEGNAGETVSVPIILNGNNNVSGIDAVLKYDMALNGTSAVRREDIEGSSGNWNDGTYGYTGIWIYGNNAFADGQIAYINFTIPENAEAGTEYNIEISILSSVKQHDPYEDITASTIINSGKIKVAGSQPEESDDEIILGSVEGKKGETVRIPLKVSGNNSISVIDAIVSYDAELNGTSAIKNMGVNGSSEAWTYGSMGYTSFAVYADTTFNDGDILYIDFTIPASAETGKEYQIAFSTVNCVEKNSSDNSVNITNSIRKTSGIIKVKDEEIVEKAEKLSIESTYDSAGKTVLVPVMFESNNNVSVVDMTISYPEELGDVNAVSEAGSISVNKWNSDGKCYMTMTISSERVFSDGQIACLSFTIPENAGIGKEYAIDISEVSKIGIFNSDRNEAARAITSGGKITVDDGEKFIIINSVNGKPGETISVPLTVKGNNNIQGIDAIISYPSELQGSEAVIAMGVNGSSQVWTEGNTGYTSFVLYTDKAFKDGELMYINFTVPSDAENGKKYQIKFDVINNISQYYPEAEITDKIIRTEGEITVVDERVIEENGIVYKTYLDHVEMEIKDFSDTVLNIPAEYSGRPVTKVDIAESLNIEYVNVDSNNTAYTSVDGVLFNKDMTTLIYYPPKMHKTEYTIPETVVKIELNAFNNPDELVKLDIPANVTDLTSDEENGKYPINVSRDKVTFYGYTDTEAEKYAYKYYYNFFNYDKGELNPNRAYGPCGENIIWNFDENGTLTISGTGKMEDYTLDDNYCSNVPWNAFIDKITTIVIENGVEYISNYAFAYHNNIKEVVIPESVLSIGTGAFLECENLERITIENPECVIYDSSSTISNTLYANSDENGHHYDGVIVGESESTAQIYAEKYLYSFEAIDQSGEDDPPVIIPTNPADIFEYDIENGGIIIYGYDESISEITVPKEIDGMPVVMIENFTFNSENLEKITFECTDVVIADTETAIYENAVICGYKNSTAQKYAEQYNRTFISLQGEDDEVKGDANDDGVFNIRDAAYIAKLIALSRKDELPLCADFNEDEVVNIRDAAAIAKYFANAGRN